MKDESNVWLDLIWALFLVGLGMSITSAFCDIRVYINGVAFDRVFYWLSLILMTPEYLWCTVVLVAWLWCKTWVRFTK